MPKLTPEQIAKIRQKEKETPDALKREALSNYTEGWFHVTLNVRGEAPLLGHITGSVEAPDGSSNAPRCELTELGRKVEESWKTITSYYPEIETDKFIVMPEHVHGLLHLKLTNRVHLGQIIRGFMIGCTHGYWETLGITNSDKEQKKSGIPQVTTDRDHTRSFRGPALFVRGYNDVEAIGEEEIEIKRAYIRNNPRKRLIQGMNHDCFRVFRHQHSRNWTHEVALAAIAADAFFARNGEACREAQHKVQERLDDGLSFVGNRQLLAHEQKLPLVCHRRDAYCFEQQKEAVLRAARKGTVIVSAFISPREREIMKQLMEEQLPFIEIMDNGFSDRYKPTGQAFYACGENRLTQITCWRYQYQRDSQISREMCLVMNQLVRIISKTTDEWWKKL